jgi:hypothetical protein
MDGTIPRPKIRACSISDPFVLIFREDDTIGLFIGETERGKIRRKDMSPMGDKVSQHRMTCAPVIIPLLCLLSSHPVICVAASIWMPRVCSIVSSKEARMRRSLPQSNPSAWKVEVSGLCCCGLKASWRLVPRTDHRKGMLIYNRSDVDSSQVNSHFFKLGNRNSSKCSYRLA